MQILGIWKKHFRETKLITTKSCQYCVDRNLQIPVNNKSFKMYPLDEFNIKIWNLTTFLTNRGSIHIAASNQTDLALVM